MSQTPLPRDSEDPTERARAAMIAEINREVAATEAWLGRARLDPTVVAAMARVPRHLFVPAELREHAYDNRPLPIGQGQTISQPYIVAAMTDLAALGPGDRVLEVGTGCGYQSAVLAELVDKVYSIETIPELALAAAERLAAMGYGNIEVRQGDGARGLPEEAPFDAIVVTAAAMQRVPPALIDQLAPGGRLIIPLQRQTSRLPWTLRQDQELLLLTKDEAGEITEKVVLPVAFVPLIEGRREG